MQIHKFESGGFCIHKASLTGSSRVFSVWFNADRKLIDAEARDKTGRVRPVLPMNAPRQWEALQRKYKDVV